MSRQHVSAVVEEVWENGRYQPLVGLRCYTNEDSKLPGPAIRILNGMPHPAPPYWTNREGTVELKKEDIHTPHGWVFTDDWQVDEDREFVQQDRLVKRRELAAQLASCSREIVLIESLFASLLSDSTQRETFLQSLSAAQRDSLLQKLRHAGNVKGEHVSAAEGDLKLSFARTQALRPDCIASWKKLCAATLSGGRKIVATKQSELLGITGDDGLMSIDELTDGLRNDCDFAALDFRRLCEVHDEAAALRELLQALALAQCMSENVKQEISAIDVAIDELRTMSRNEGWVYVAGSKLDFYHAQQNYTLTPPETLSSSTYRRRRWVRLRMRDLMADQEEEKTGNGKSESKTRRRSNSIPNMVKGGKLDKRSSKKDFFRNAYNWRGRYFVLFTSGELFYYKTSKDAVAKRHQGEPFDVTKLSAIERVGQCDGAPNAFILRLVSPERTLYICCKSKTELEEWSVAIAQTSKNPALTDKPVRTVNRMSALSPKDAPYRATPSPAPTEDVLSFTVEARVAAWQDEPRAAMQWFPTVIASSQTRVFLDEAQMQLTSQQREDRWTIAALEQFLMAAPLPEAPRPRTLKTAILVVTVLNATGVKKDKYHVKARHTSLPKEREFKSGVSDGSGVFPTEGNMFRLKTNDTSTENPVFLDLRHRKLMRNAAVGRVSINIAELSKHPERDRATGLVRIETRLPLEPLPDQKDKEFSEACIQGKSFLRVVLELKPDLANVSYFPQPLTERNYLWQTISDSKFAPQLRVRVTVGEARLGMSQQRFAALRQHIGRGGYEDSTNEDDFAEEVTTLNYRLLLLKRATLAAFKHDVDAFSGYCDRQIVVIFSGLLWSIFAIARMANTAGVKARWPAKHVDRTQLPYRYGSADGGFNGLTVFEFADRVGLCCVQLRAMFVSAYEEYSDEQRFNEIELLAEYIHIIYGNHLIYKVPCGNSHGCGGCEIGKLLRCENSPRKDRQLEALCIPPRLSTQFHELLLRGCIKRPDPEDEASLDADLEDRVCSLCDDWEVLFKTVVTVFGSNAHRLSDRTHHVLLARMLFDIVQSHSLGSDGNGLDAEGAIWTQLLAILKKIAPFAVSELATTQAEAEEKLNQRRLAREELVDGSVEATKLLQSALGFVLIKLEQWLDTCLDCEEDATTNVAVGFSVYRRLLTICCPGMDRKAREVQLCHVMSNAAFQHVQMLSQENLIEALPDDKRDEMEKKFAGAEQQTVAADVAELFSHSSDKGNCDEKLNIDQDLCKQLRDEKETCCVKRGGLGYDMEIFWLGNPVDDDAKTRKKIEDGQEVERTGGIALDIKETLDYLQQVFSAAESLEKQEVCEDEFECLRREQYSSLDVLSFLNSAMTKEAKDAKQGAVSAKLNVTRPDLQMQDIAEEGDEGKPSPSSGDDAHDVTSLSLRGSLLICVLTMAQWFAKYCEQFFHDAITVDFLDAKTIPPPLLRCMKHITQTQLAFLDAVTPEERVLVKQQLPNLNKLFSVPLAAVLDNLRADNVNKVLRCLELDKWTSTGLQSDGSRVKGVHFSTSVTQLFFFINLMKSALLGMLLNTTPYALDMAVYFAEGVQKMSLFYCDSIRASLKSQMEDNWLIMNGFDSKNASNLILAKAMKFARHNFLSRRSRRQERMREKICEASACMWGVTREAIADGDPKKLVSALWGAVASVPKELLHDPGKLFEPVLQIHQSINEALPLGLRKVDLHGKAKVADVLNNLGRRNEDNVIQERALESVKDSEAKGYAAAGLKLSAIASQPMTGAVDGMLHIGRFVIVSIAHNYKHQKPLFDLDFKQLGQDQKIKVKSVEKLEAEVQEQQEEEHLEDQKVAAVGGELTPSQLCVKLSCLFKTTELMREFHAEMAEYVETHRSQDAESDDDLKEEAVTEDPAAIQSKNMTMAGVMAELESDLFDDTARQSRTAANRLLQLRSVGALTLLEFSHEMSSMLATLVVYNKLSSQLQRLYEEPLDGDACSLAALPLVNELGKTLQAISEELPAQHFNIVMTAVCQALLEALLGMVKARALRQFGKYSEADQAKFREIVENDVELVLNLFSLSLNAEDSARMLEQTTCRLHKMLGKSAADAKPIERVRRASAMEEEEITIDLSVEEWFYESSDEEFPREAQDSN